MEHSRAATPDSQTKAPQGLRARDLDRERCVAQLQDAYVEGALGYDELDARLALAVQARTVAQLDGLLQDLLPETESTPQGPRVPRSRPSRARRLGLTSAGLVLIALDILGVAAATPAADLDPCPSTGQVADTSSPCPELTREQRAIQRSANVAEAAAERAADAAQGRPEGSKESTAARQAMAAADRAGLAVSEAQAVVAEALPEAPTARALAPSVGHGRTAATAAVAAARRAEAAGR